MSKRTASTTKRTHTRPAAPTAAPSPAAMTWHSHSWLVGIGIFILAFALYSNTLYHGFTMDDPLVVNKNKYVQQGTAGIRAIFTHGYLEGYSGRADYDSYRPLPLAMYAFEKDMYGGQSSDHHTAHVLLYALACVLLYRFLRRLLADYSVWMPLCITVLFVVHPLHTEVVANIKSRDEILAFIGLVWMQTALLRYADTKQSSALLQAIVAFVLALFSKESAVAALVLAPLTMYYGRGVTNLKQLGKVILMLLPFVGLYFAIRAGVADESAAQNTVLENTLLGANGLSQRLASAFALLSRYYQLVVWPHPLSVDYSYNQLPLTTWADPRAWLGLLGTGGLAAFAFYSLLKRPHAGGYGVWWFGLTFALTSNLVVLVGSTFAERFLFTPLLGLLLLGAWVLHLLLAKSGESAPTFAYAITALLALPWLLMTWQRNKDWVSDEKLFEKQLIVAPNSARTYITLGNMAYTQYTVDLDKANQAKTGGDSTLRKHPALLRSIEQFQRALAIYEPASITNYSLGISLKAAGRYPEAVTALERAVALDSTAFKPWLHLGVAYAFTDRWHEAQTAYLRALSKEPNNLMLLKNIAYTYRKTQAPSQALFYLEKALLLAPKDTDVLSQLIKVHRDDRKDMEKAIYYNQLLAKALGK